MLYIVSCMSEHDYLSSAPAPERSAADDEALRKMQRDFPGHRIWREIIPGRTVYVARSQHPFIRTPSSPPTYANCTPH
jgi:hypothetical protein